MYSKRRRENVTFIPFLIPFQKKRSGLRPGSLFIPRFFTLLFPLLFRLGMEYASAAYSPYFLPEIIEAFRNRAKTPVLSIARTTQKNRMLYSGQEMTLLKALSGSSARKPFPYKTLSHSVLKNRLTIPLSTPSASSILGNVSFFL